MGHKMSTENNEHQHISTHEIELYALKTIFFEVYKNNVLIFNKEEVKYSESKTITLPYDKLTDYNFSFKIYDSTKKYLGTYKYKFTIKIGLLTLMLVDDENQCVMLVDGINQCVMVNENDKRLQVLKETVVINFKF
jgi:hypothetical protein